MNWSRIQSEVSKIVQSEMSKLTTKSVQVTSSPFEDDEIEKFRKILVSNVVVICPELFIYLLDKRYFWFSILWTESN